MHCNYTDHLLPLLPNAFLRKQFRLEGNFGDDLIKSNQIAQSLTPSFKNLWGLRLLCTICSNSSFHFTFYTLNLCSIVKTNLYPHTGIRSFSSISAYYCANTVTHTVTKKPVTFFFPLLQIWIDFLQTSNKSEKCNTVIPGQEHLNSINFAAADFSAHSKPIRYQALTFLPVNPLKKPFPFFITSPHPQAIPLPHTNANA